MVLEKIKEPLNVNEPKVIHGDQMEVIVTAANGDIVAQGFVVREKDQWKYVAPITGLQIILRDPQKNA
jgi:hypothetical protein